MKEEYCIWHPFIGQMDTSTNWKKLFKIVQKYNGSYQFSRLSIIPTHFIGTSGKYKTIKQLREETDKMYREAMNK